MHPDVTLASSSPAVIEQNNTALQPATVGSNDIVDLQLSLEWDSQQGHHTEIRHFYKFNIWRDLDLLPFELHAQIINQPVNSPGSTTVPAGDAIPRYSDSQVHKVKRSNFNQHFRGREVIPLKGRFYPQEILKEIPGVLPGSVLPMRVIDMNDSSLSCDLNHPMAGYNLKVETLVNAIYGAPEEHGGSCQDAMTQILAGPGMQVRSNGQPTDFFTQDAFGRMDDTADTAFYSMSRMTDHLDTMAISQVKNLYGRLLPKNARILDLMSSISSHVPEEAAAASITGLGMNEQELAANSQLSEHLVHDLNSNPALPFADGSFDAVICTVSVEYLTQPLAVFKEVNRILKPGGIFINTFSNRWFPPKVINLWIDLHEFERMGLVSEYYLQSGHFGAVNTWSQQGLKRPADDPHAMQSPWSDPLYAVWSHKSET